MTTNKNVFYMSKTKGKKVGDNLLIYTRHPKDQSSRDYEKRRRRRRRTSKKKNQILNNKKK